MLRSQTDKQTMLTERPRRYLRLSLVLLSVLAVGSQSQETGLLCGNVEGERADVPKSSYDDVGKEWSFTFEYGCCTLAGTSNPEYKKLENNLTTFLGDAYRTAGQVDAICENLDDNLLKTACTEADIAMSMNVSASFQTHTECCCSSCRCFGDPICQSFHKDLTSYTTNEYTDFDTWILCDGRTASCVVTEDECVKQKDYNGKKCVFNEDAPIYGVKSPSLNTIEELKKASKKDLENHKCSTAPRNAWQKSPPEACMVPRWDVFKNGSPCMPKEGSSNPLSMYAIDDKFDFTVYQADRGYINKIEITSACNKVEYSLTVEDCLAGKDWEKKGNGEDVIKFQKHPYSQIDGGRWSFLDYSTGVTGDITCYANGVKFDEDGNVVELYVPRFNVEHLNDPLWRWNRNDHGFEHKIEGYCTSGEFELGKASNPFKAEMDRECQNPSRGNLAFIRLTQFREICRDTILSPEIPECVTEFCTKFIDETPHLSSGEKESRKKECIELMEATDDISGRDRYEVRPESWPRSYQQGFCHTVMCSRKKEYCINPSDCFESKTEPDSPTVKPTPSPTLNSKCKEIFEKCEEPFTRPFETLDDAKVPVRVAIEEFQLTELPVWNRKSNDFIGDITVDQSEYPEYDYDCEDELAICVRPIEPDTSKKSLNPDERGSVLQYYDKNTKKWVDFQAFPEYDERQECYVDTYTPIEYSQEESPEIFENEIRMIQVEKKYQRLEITRCGVTHIPTITFHIRVTPTPFPTPLPTPDTPPPMTPTPLPTPDTPPPNLVFAIPICPLCIDKDTGKSKEKFIEKEGDNNNVIVVADSCCQLCDSSLVPDYRPPFEKEKQTASRWYDTTIEKLCDANKDISKGGGCGEAIKDDNAELVVNFTFNKEFNNCCLICHAFGDPVIRDFVGNKEKWALCHARNEDKDLDECPPYEEDLCNELGSNCTWRPENDNWANEISTYGSPCQPLVDDFVTLYKKEKDGQALEVRANQGNRGIMTKAFVSFGGKQWTITDKCSVTGDANGYETIQVGVNDTEFRFKEVLDCQIRIICFPDNLQRGISIMVIDEDELYDTVAEFEEKIQEGDLMAQGACRGLDTYDFESKHPLASMFSLVGPCEKRPGLDRLGSYRGMCDKYDVAATADWQVKECLETFCSHDNADFVRRGKISEEKCASRLYFSDGGWESNKGTFINRMCEMITLNNEQMDMCTTQIKESLEDKATYFAIRDEFNVWTSANHGKGQKVENSGFCNKNKFIDDRLPLLTDPAAVPNLPNYCCNSFDRDLIDDFNNKELNYLYVPGVYLQYCDYDENEDECYDDDRHVFAWKAGIEADPWKTFEYIPYDTCLSQERSLDQGKVTFDGFGNVIFKYTKKDDKYSKVFDKPIRVFQTDMNPVEKPGEKPSKPADNVCNTNTGLDFEFKFSVSN